MTEANFSKGFEGIDLNDNTMEEIKNNVKCCIFYFLEMVLLLADRARLVKNKNFKIIYNEDLCNKYPKWVNLCYDLTLQSLRSKMDMKKSKTHYSLYGFPLAF